MVSAFVAAGVVILDRQPGLPDAIEGSAHFGVHEPGADVQIARVGHGGRPSGRADLSRGLELEIHPTGPGPPTQAKAGREQPAVAGLQGRVILFVQPIAVDFQGGGPIIERSHP